MIFPHTLEYSNVALEKVTEESESLTHVRWTDIFSCCMLLSSNLSSMVEKLLSIDVFNCCALSLGSVCLKDDNSDFRLANSRNKRTKQPVISISIMIMKDVAVKHFHLLFSVVPLLCLLPVFLAAADASV